MKELIGQDLSGWRIEVWYELRLLPDERGVGRRSGRYFTDKNLAIVSGKGKSCYGSDGDVVEVFVLTKTGDAGFLIGESVKQSEENVFRESAIKAIKSKLTPEEMQLLKIE